MEGMSPPKSERERGGGIWKEIRYPVVGESEDIVKLRGTKLQTLLSKDNHKFTDQLQHVLYTRTLLIMERWDVRVKGFYQVE